MRLLKSRFVTALVIYFAGFGTAIYYLAPQDAQAEGYSEVASSQVDAAGEKAAFELGEGLRKCVDMVSVKSDEFGEFIKEKIADCKDSEEECGESK